MAEVQLKLSGWQGALALAVVVVLIGVRLASLGDRMDDEELRSKLEYELMTEYFPSDAAQLRAVVDAGDRDAMARMVKSVSSSKIRIDAIETSAPLLSLGSGGEVVVKVTYALEDAYGARDAGTRYYLFEHGVIGSTWRFRFETGAWRYYLNFF